DFRKVKEDEIGKFIPSELYGLSKLMMSDIVKEREDILMLNIFACYGIGEKESRFPNYAIGQAVKNLPIEINQNVVFDYLYVDDMVRIVKHFIEHFPKDKIINITPNNSVSLKETAEIIRKNSGKRFNIIIKNSKMNYEYTGDNSILLKNIPNFEFTPMEIGLKNMYEYNRERSNV
ncbi:MAG: NAD(P)-dependent oxidoreductase, partial [bacterium]|nr:NAD(P)-dependent oxidoreductase [bacterium]